ncbi:MAG: FG-GAP-like repeat-containing protein [Chlorobi bacterium]|nr:FG-GAP-like repeat-containing protein [Chlorobiota bacterium]MCI0714809.1 FG-GAP-like repeat-containing protein [Chlorobiota bacterium]
MKKIIVTIIFLSSNLLLSQTLFQKITNQPLVQDNAYGSGCAWGDYNNDGKLDLIVTSYNDFGPSIYPRLYKNVGNGNFQLVTNSSVMTNSLYQTLACAWGDYNYDGKLDLFISTGFNQPDLLYKNIGGGNFIRVTDCSPVTAPGHSGGIAWADYNRDGYLDIFVPQHGTNLLYKGLPNGQFQQITTGPIVTDVGIHRRGTWGDYNNDKYPDLFVANGDFQNDNLYLNNRNGTFTKITTGAIVNSPGYGSGCSWGDYNNDGWLDLFVANSGPNFLYKNNRNGTFTKIATGSIATDANNSFGCSWGDYDNDGDLDIFVANNELQKNSLYRNEGGDNFVKITNDIVVNEVSSSASWGDYNNDGKLDLFVVNQGYGTSAENDFLYKNVNAHPFYIIIKLFGGGIGTRIKIRIGNYIAIREVSGGNSCSSQDMPWVHFGLGFLGDNPTATIDSLIVDWHDGNREVLTNVSINQVIEFHGIISVQQTSSEVPSKYSLYQNYPNPFNPSTTINYDLVKNSHVKLKVYDISGSEISVLVDELQSYGTYSVKYNASNLASGVYFYKLQTEGFTDTKKMILVK